jgi:hypothetical protein
MALEIEHFHVAYRGIGSIGSIGSISVSARDTAQCPVPCSISRCFFRTDKLN